ncbi:MAG: SprT family zinc-dependent metalloprotease [Elusimicrobiota bacterium]
MNIEISEIKRSKRRSIALQVNRKGEVIIRAPHYVSNKEIEKIILNKEKWIMKKKETIREWEAKKCCHSYTDGGQILFLGDLYTMRFGSWDTKEIVLLENEILVHERYIKTPNKKIEKWYKEEAGKRFCERVELYANLNGVAVKSVRVNSAKSQWGSCNSKKDLSFTWRLIMAPRKVIDYVILHELCHINELNHSSRFWSRVACVMPDYKSCKKWLRENEYILGL